VAPSSMRAWFHSPGWASSGIRLWANPWRALGEARSRAKRRARTRRTLPSTAATRSPKAMEATAAAV